MKYLDPNEVLLAGELWDRLSGKTKTMEQILDIINSIATPEFMKQYNFLNDPLNVDRDRPRYGTLLNKWGLIQEAKIVENIDTIREVFKEKKRSPRQLNNSIFDSDARYKSDRYSILFEPVLDSNSV